MDSGSIASEAKIAAPAPAADQTILPPQPADFEEQLEEAQQAFVDHVRDLKVYIDYISALTTVLLLLSLAWYLMLVEWSVYNLLALPFVCSFLLVASLHLVATTDAFLTFLGAKFASLCSVDGPLRRAYLRPSRTLRYIRWAIGMAMLGGAVYTADKLITRIAMFASHPGS